MRTTHPTHGTGRPQRATNLGEKPEPAQSLRSNERHWMGCGLSYSFRMLRTRRHNFLFITRPFHKDGSSKEQAHGLTKMMPSAAVALLLTCVVRIFLAKMCASSLLTWHTFWVHSVSQGRTVSLAGLAKLHTFSVRSQRSWKA